VDRPTRGPDRDGADDALTMKWMKGDGAMDPEFKWVIQLIAAVADVVSLIETGRRRGWI